jgi:hypothetical protein
MKLKFFVAGFLVCYSLVLVLGLLNMPTIYFIPIKIADIEVGKIITILFLLGISFLLIKK